MMWIFPATKKTAEAVRSGESVEKEFHTQQVVDMYNVGGSDQKLERTKIKRDVGG